MKAIKMLMMAALTIVSVSLFAQDSTKHKSKMQKMEQMKYSCHMKCEGEKTYDKPGKCPKCGMDLTKSKKEQMKMEVMKTYTCPMHPDVTSDKPGKCSKCGMALKEKETAVVAYSCPMKCEGDKTYDKPGNCPKCGMALKEQKDDHSNHKH
jgi:transcription initiation factor IIE alpha subunit